METGRKTPSFPQRRPFFSSPAGRWTRRQRNKNSSNLLLYVMEMSCLDNELPNKLILVPTMSQRTYPGTEGTSLRLWKSQRTMAAAREADNHLQPCCANHVRGLAEGRMAAARASKFEIPTQKQDFSLKSNTVLVPSGPGSKQFLCPGLLLAFRRVLLFHHGGFNRTGRVPE